MPSGYSSDMKKLIIISLVALFGLQVSAQRKAHEFSVWGGGGLSTLTYQLSLGDRSGNVGGDFGIGYTFCQTQDKVTGTGNLYRESWGIFTGLGIAMYNTTAKLDGFKTVTTGLLDSEKDKFDLSTTLNGYNESQSAMYLNIPVMAQFDIHQFYVMGGFKIGVPLNSNYTSKNATLINEAYYVDYGVNLTTQEFAGYGKFDGRDSNGSMDLGVSLMLSLESGYKWKVGEFLSLYTGLYLDYGVSNSSKGVSTKFVNFDNTNPKDFTTNSILAAAEKVHIMAVGFKLRLAFEKM